MKLSISKDTPCRIPRTRIVRLAELVAQKERIKPTAALNLVLVNDSAQRKLNREYRNKDKTTDVLSFSYKTDRFSDLIGEIYISVPQARRQALEYGGGISDELLRLFCHGLLHVIGYDHDNPRSERAMFGKQNRYLAHFRPALKEGR